MTIPGLGPPNAPLLCQRNTGGTSRMIYGVAGCRSVPLASSTPTFIFDKPLGCALHLLGTEAAQLHFVVCALVFRMVLEPLALEILHQVGLAVILAHFSERLRYRQAKLSDAAQP